jgi:hypothetical protein
MKQLPKVIILLLAGFIAGFNLQSVLAVVFKKARNAEYVASAEGLVGVLRAKVKVYQAKTGRFPRDAAEMQAQGFWTVADPPREWLGQGGSRWVPAFDGEGGFLYLSATGQIYLNTDLSREKLRWADRQRVRALVPPGTLY